jgi:hypothetical protein
MSDLYEVLFGEKQKDEKAFFYTDDEGRVRFAGGPGSGSGTGGSGGADGNSTSVLVDKRKSDFVDWYAKHSAELGNRAKYSAGAIRDARDGILDENVRESWYNQFVETNDMNLFEKYEVAKYVSDLFNFYETSPGFSWGS